MKSEISRIVYDVVHKCHDEWRDKHGYRFNNQIIDLLRNRLWMDAQEFYEVNITKRLLDIPRQYRSPRNFLANLSFRRFKEGFESKPCEICNFERALNVAHIIPRAFGGPDDDWNLVHLCANHHYLFDRGLLTKDEYYAIRWDEKGSEARYFAEHVRQDNINPIGIVRQSASPRAGFSIYGWKGRDNHQVFFRSDYSDFFCNRTHRKKMGRVPFPLSWGGEYNPESVNVKPFPVLPFHATRLL